MADSLDEHIDNFIEAFRASERTFTPGSEICLDCIAPAMTYCENCKAGLCDAHADSETYADVDICKDLNRCNERLIAKETEASK